MNSSKSVVFGLVLIASVTLASAQGLPPVATPTANGPINVPPAAQPNQGKRNAPDVKPVIEAPTAPIPKSGYPRASDSQGISLGDTEADVRRKAAKLGFRLEAEDRFNSEAGLPTRVARLSFLRPVPTTFLQEQLGVAFTSTTSKVVVVSRTQIFLEPLQQSVVKQQLIAKYGKPSKVSQDGISAQSWESDRTGSPFPNAGARCRAPDFRFYALNIHGANPLCETAIEVRVGTDAGTGLVTSLSLDMMDSAASAADYLRMAELVKADRAATVNRAGQATKPLF